MMFHVRQQVVQVGPWSMWFGICRILQFAPFCIPQPASSVSSFSEASSLDRRTKTESVTRVSRPKRPGQEPHRTKSVTGAH